LNYATAKSALLAAYMPSRPAIPTPTSAFIIIATSFAPSPIASVTSLGWFLFTSSTISPF